MSETIINCEGLACPQPVIRLRDLLDSEAPEQVAIIVDNEPALENVSRFLASRGYSHDSQRQGALWRIAGARQAEAGGGQGTGAQAAKTPAASPDQAAKTPAVSPDQAAGKAPETRQTLIILSSALFGAGDDELGAKLMKNFLATLPEMGESLWRIVMLNGGVTLSIADSPVIDELRRLADSGVSLLVCGACLDHYKLLEQKAVGETTNMLDIVTSMELADKVIRI
jgi:selenium metabolism protein YedF